MDFFGVLRFELLAVALKRERIFRQTGVLGRLVSRLEDFCGLHAAGGLGSSAPSIRGFESI